MSRNADFTTGVEQTLKTIVQNECVAITKEVHIQTKKKLNSLSVGAPIKLSAWSFTCWLLKK